MKTRAAALLVVASVAAPAFAQSLADVARRTEDQRTAASGASREYSNATLGGASGYAALLGDSYLLANHFEAYAIARNTLAQYRLTHFDLDVWLHERTIKAKDRFDLEQIYGQDADVRRSLGRLTPREYFKTDLAVQIALEDVRRPRLDREATLPAARAANAQYVEDNNLVSWAGDRQTEQELEHKRANYKRAYQR